MINNKNRCKKELEDFYTITEEFIASGYKNTFVEISPYLSVNSYKSMCDIVSKITIEIADFVNLIAFRKSSIIMLLDPDFNFKNITSFRNSFNWKYILDCDNYTKGFVRKLKDYPPIFIIKHIIWVKETRA